MAGPFQNEYHRGVDYALRKTGDTMYPGTTIVLGRDATVGKEAVTFDQLSQAGGNGTRVILTSGSEYGGTYASSRSDQTISVAGSAYISPFINVPGTVFNRASVRQTNAGTSTVRCGVYLLDPSTFFPTEILADFGTLSFAGAGGDGSLSINFSSDEPVLGLCTFWESLGAPLPSYIGDALNTYVYWPYGRGQGGGFATISAYRMQVTGASAGGMPSPASFGLSLNALSGGTLHGAGLHMRVA